LELVYLWVEDYKNIKKQGFNFSPRFHCEYDEENDELTIDENDDYIPDFFGENINVTAIVGKNGSGKSSVLEYLLTSDDKIIITLENNQFSISSSALINNLTKFKYEKKHSNKIIGIENVKAFIDTDISKSDLAFFKEKEGHYSSKLSYLNTAKISSHRDFYQFIPLGLQIDMFLKSKNSLHEIIFPKNIILIFQYWKGHAYQFKNRKLSLAEFVYLYAFMEFKNGVHIETTAELRKTIDVYLTQKNKTMKEIFFSFEKECKEANLNLSFYNDLKNYCESFQVYTDIYMDNELSFRRTDEEYFDIQFKINVNDFNKNILNEERHCFHTFYYIWDIKLSSGEGKLLSLLSSISYEVWLHNSISYFLIDEGETFLHPNWQKKYLSYIIQFIKDNFPNRKIHIILTSHSPFLLSDIPKQNIIFLDKDKNGNCKVVDGLKEKKQTFGANIHTLLSDSFFMEDGLMGEFAKSKIDRAIELLNQEQLNEDELKYCEQIISIIGEPIVKNQLQRMLDSKRLKKIDEIDAIKKSMIAMKQRLDELEK